MWENRTAMARAGIARIKDGFISFISFVAKSGRRIGVTAAGAALVVAGAVMLVTPGPGTLVLLAGIALLATEYLWARRLLEKVREKAGEVREAVRGREDSRRKAASHPEAAGPDGKGGDG